MLRLALVAAVAVSVHGAGHMGPKPGSISIDSGIMNIRTPKVGGDVNFARSVDEATSLPKLKATLASIKNNLYTQDGDQVQKAAASAAALKASFAKIDDLNKVNDDVVAAVGTLEDEMKAKVAAVTKDFAEALDKTNAQFADVQDKLGKKVEANAALLSTIEATTVSNDDLAAEIEEMKNSGKKMQDAINENVGAQVIDMEANMANLVPVKRHIWSGGAKKTHQSGGWHDFAYDREEFNTAAPYFKKESNTRFKILKDGLFHFSYTWMGHCHWSHRHAHFYINGKNLNGNMHVWAQHWHTNHVDITWRVKANHLAWLRVYACNHAWHGSNNINSHNRVRVEYIGEMPKDCKGLACDGQ